MTLVSFSKKQVHIVEGVVFDYQCLALVVGGMGRVRQLFGDEYSAASPMEASPESMLPFFPRGIFIVLPEGGGKKVLRHDSLKGLEQQVTKKPKVNVGRRIEIGTYDVNQKIIRRKDVMFTSSEELVAWVAKKFKESPIVYSLLLRVDESTWNVHRGPGVKGKCNAAFAFAKKPKVKGKPEGEPEGEPEAEKGVGKDTEMMADMINNPPHYRHPTIKNLECIDVIEVFPHNIAAAMGYLWRADRKHDTPIEDYEKAVWHIMREVKVLSGYCAKVLAEEEGY